MRSWLVACSHICSHCVKMFIQDWSSSIIDLFCWQIGLSSTTIASSFGKAISDNKELEDYKPEDITRSLLRMISNNIGQVSFSSTILYSMNWILCGKAVLLEHTFLWAPIGKWKLWSGIHILLILNSLVKP